MKYNLFRKTLQKCWIELQKDVDLFNCILLCHFAGRFLSCSATVYSLWKSFKLSNLLEKHGDGNVWRITFFHISCLLLQEIHIFILAYFAVFSPMYNQRIIYSGRAESMSLRSIASYLKERQFAYNFLYRVKGMLHLQILMSNIVENNVLKFEVFKCAIW